MSVDDENYSALRPPFLGRSCEKYIEEKAEYSITIGNLEDEVEKTTNRCRELEGELEIERRQRQEEQDEWAQFQQVR